jgi:thymidylate synthase ThyX
MYSCYGDHHTHSSNFDKSQMSEAILIGLNGKFTKEFSDKISELKDNGTIDTDCYNGSNYERLSELSGRLCYRSGYTSSKNRNSKDYHAHIREVGHHSIYGHNIIHVELTDKLYRDWCIGFAGLPGWYPKREKGKNFIGVNFRLIENTYRNTLRTDSETDCLTTFYSVYELARKKAPFIFVDKANSHVGLEVLTDEQIKEFELEWYSFQIKTSRRVAQELTRHGFQTAISMESTRYVDITENTFIKHPFDSVSQVAMEKIQKYCLDQYSSCQKQVYEDLINEGKDKSYSRKQSRGAAASYMPLGLETNLVFSCSKPEFEEIKRQRISDSADREIYELVKKMDEVSKQ